MKKFIIIWNSGFGENAEVINALSEGEAENIAYQAWREEAESQADYRAEPYSEELAEDYGVE